MLVIANISTRNHRAQWRLRKCTYWRKEFGSYGFFEFDFFIVLSQSRSYWTKKRKKKKRDPIGPSSK